MTVAVVLAAGLGTRLSSNGGLPKWLTPVGETSPAEVQLAGLVEAQVTEVAVVVGPGSDAITTFVQPWRSEIDVHLVPNHLHRERNNWYSLLLGLDAVADTAGAGGVVVLNSDLFASGDWMGAAISSLQARHADAALIVDLHRSLTREAMKVAVEPSTRTTSKIGKTGVDQPVGEYVGMAWWGATAMGEVDSVLRQFIDRPERVDNWYEHAIDVHIQAGAAYQVVDVPGPDWVEIDDDGDRMNAEALRVERPAVIRGRPTAG